MFKVSAALSLLALGLVAAIPGRADLFLDLGAQAGRSSVTCCQTLTFTTEGNGIANFAGLSSAGTGISGGTLVGPPEDFPANIVLSTGALIGTTGNSWTFDGGTLGIGGGTLFFNKTNMAACEADGGFWWLGLDFDYCNYGDISTGTLLGDVTLTQDGAGFFGSLYSFTAIAQFLYSPPESMGSGRLFSLYPTVLYQGQLTGSFFGPNPLDGSQGFLNAEFNDLSFRGIGTPVPEPSSLLMIGTIIALFLGLYFRARRSSSRRSPSPVTSAANFPITNRI
jgi:hypothetical protein